MKHHTIQDVLEGWENTSSPNDECPSYTFKSLRLYVDEEYMDREDPEYYKYQLHYIDEEGECQYPMLYATDNGEDMVEQVNGYLSDS